MSVFARKTIIIALGVGFSVACMLLTLWVHPNRKTLTPPDGPDAPTYDDMAGSPPFYGDHEDAAAAGRRTAAHQQASGASQRIAQSQPWAVAPADLEAGHWRSTTMLSPVWRSSSDTSADAGAVALHRVDGDAGLPLSDAPLPREPAVPVAQREADEGMNPAAAVATAGQPTTLVAAGVDDPTLTAAGDEALETDRMTRQASFIAGEMLEGSEPALRRNKGTNITLSRMSPMINPPREALVGWASVDRVRLALNVGIISAVVFAIGAWLYGRARARSPQT